MHLMLLSESETVLSPAFVADVQKAWATACQAMAETMGTTDQQGVLRILDSMKTTHIVSLSCATDTEQAGQSITELD